MSLSMSDRVVFQVRLERADPLPPLRAAAPRRPDRPDVSEMEHLQAVEAESERLRAQAETRHAQSPPLVVNGPPVICDGHDVAMVRDARFMGWRCPQGGAWLGDEEYHWLVSPLGSRPDLTAVRVTGCGESP